MVKLDYDDEEYLKNIIDEEYPNLIVEIIVDILDDIITIYDNEKRYIDNMVNHIRNYTYFYTFEELINEFKNNDLLNIGGGFILYECGDYNFKNDSKQYIVIEKARHFERRRCYL